MTRTGIFGGSYNPIHTGHIALAKRFQAEAALDEVWLMVSPQNPLKRNADLLDEEKRLTMVRKALEEEPNIVACDYEFHLPRPSYTWDTLQAMRKDYPNRVFTLLIGGDNWALFPRWYRAEDLLANYEIAIYPREDARIDPSTLPENVRLLTAELMNISSTEIRRRIQLGLPIHGMVPEKIEQQVIESYRKP